jgi:hypothetical protein
VDIRDVVKFMGISAEQFNQFLEYRAHSLNGRNDVKRCDSNSNSREDSSFT